ncbi:GNAT family N-acetyltransferase [Enterococcus sp. LJL90]
MAAIYLRDFTDGDLSLMSEWLTQPHVAAWFEHPQNWLAEIRGRQTEYRWIQHFIVMLAEQPIGFCQYYDCYFANQLEDWYEVNQPGAVFSLDYLIGAEQFLKQGYGRQIITALIEKLTRLGAKKIIVAPEKENQASIAVLLANGFQWDSVAQYFVLDLLVK